MSGIGFPELVLIFVIGLLILGPERLPRVASQIGRWVGRARRTANQLRYQLEREIAIADLKKPPEKSKEKPKEKPGNGPQDTGSTQAGAAEQEASTAADAAASEPPAAERSGPDTVAATGDAGDADATSKH